MYINSSYNNYIRNGNRTNISSLKSNTDDDDISLDNPCNNFDTLELSSANITVTSNIPKNIQGKLTELKNYEPVKWTADYDYQAEEGKANLYFVKLENTLCENTISSITDKLDISDDFSIIWNSESKNIKISGLSNDEQRINLEDALNSDKSVSFYLDRISECDKIANDRIDEIYYPKMEKYLQDTFGQDISDLSIVENKIIGANEKLQDYLDNEKEPTYPYKTVVLKELLKDGKPDINNISNYTFKDGKLGMVDGEIRLGDGQITDEQVTDERFLQKMQYITSPTGCLWYYQKATNKGHFQNE